MYSNSAYLGRFNEDISDKSKPIVVTAAGYYRVHTSSVIETKRPNGRKDYQLIYVASGKLHLHIVGEEKIIAKGNMILFRPGEKQLYYLYSVEKPEIYWVHFTGNNIEEMLERNNMQSNKNLFFAGTSPDYPWMYRQMIRELQLRRTNYEEILNIHLQQLFLIINRYLKEENDVGSKILDEIEKSIRYFNEFYNKDIQIEKYARDHFMTPCWFIQNFKRVTKNTPKQYIVSLRITSAMNLLDNTKYNVYEIANAVGYDNTQYFCRLFKKYTGMTPLEYQNRSNNKVIENYEYDSKTI